MTIESEHIEQLTKEVMSYAQSHYGIPNGPDFVELAQVVCNSASFKHLLEVASLAGVISTFGISKENKPQSGEEALAFLAKSPVNEFVLQAFYIGYRYGRAVAEQKVLEQISEEVK